MPEPRSAFVECYCPDCGQLLQVKSTNQNAIFDLGGESFVMSKYACQGEERHPWEDFAIFGDGGVLAHLALGRPRKKS